MSLQKKDILILLKTICPKMKKKKINSNTGKEMLIKSNIKSRRKIKMKMKMTTTMMME